MGDKTGISWADATWNPVTGCTKVSPGCAHCYAERIVERFGHRPGMTYADDQQEDAGHEHDFARVTLHRNRLDIPLHWLKPRRIFVCSMGDLFHPDVPEAFIDVVFAVMVRAHWHTYQILTKRADRMRSYMASLFNLHANASDRLSEAAFRWGDYEDMDCDVANLINGHSKARYGDIGFPPKHIWLGVSAEDQQRADERIPLLLQTPAAVRFASLEPLLGPVDLECYPSTSCPTGWLDEGGLDWVIVAGESAGPPERALVEREGYVGPDDLTHHRWAPKPDALSWVRAIVQQCRAAGVPFHFKGWGGPRPDSGGRLLDGREWLEFPVVS